jgi:flavin reductase (DIM6/NTAB) family NADH-FMN oxidoreductase RutF
MSFNESDFRHCLGCFSTGVTIVTTADKKNLHGITINSFASLSLHPPMVLFSLDKQSHTYKNFADAENFIVNILSEGQSSLSIQYAHPSTVDWNKIDYSTGTNGCPIISGSIAYLECTKENVFDGGDHSIFIGKVKNLKKISDKKPLLYFKGQYKKISDKEL